MADVTLDNSQELRVPLQSTHEEAEILGVARVFVAVTSMCRLGGSRAGGGFGLRHGCVQDAPCGALC